MSIGKFITMILLAQTRRIATPRMYVSYSDELVHHRCRCQGTFPRSSTSSQYPAVSHPSSCCFCLEGSPTLCVLFTFHRVTRTDRTQSPHRAVTVRKHTAVFWCSSHCAVEPSHHLDVCDLVCWWMLWQLQSVSPRHVCGVRVVAMVQLSSYAAWPTCLPAFSAPPASM